MDIRKQIEKGNVSVFYKSSIWLHKREEILIRDNKECQICKAKGRYHKAECVHHIKHLRQYPNLALDNSNLIAVCNSCHNKLHPEKLHLESIPKFNIGFSVYNLSYIRNFLA